MRIDVSEIEAYDNVSLFLYEFTQRERELIMAFIDSGDWRATYSHPGDDAFDRMQELYSSVLARLGEYEEVNTIAQSITNLLTKMYDTQDELVLIRDAIASLINLQDSLTAVSTQVAPGEVTVTDTDPATDPVPGGGAAPSWDDYFCMAGHAFADELAERLSTILDLDESAFLTLSAVVAVLTTTLAILSIGGAVIVVVSLIADAIAFWSAFKAIADPAVLEPTVTALRSAAVKEAFGCAFVAGAGDTEDTMGELKNAIDAEFPTYGAIVSLLYTRGLVNTLCQGNQDGSDLDMSNWQAATCSCVSPVYWKSEFDSDLDGWVNGAAVNRIEWSDSTGDGALRMFPNASFGAKAELRSSALLSVYSIPTGNLIASSVSFLMWRDSDTGEAVNLTFAVNTNLAVKQIVVNVDDIPVAADKGGATLYSFDLNLGVGEYLDHDGGSGALLEVTLPDTVTALESVRLDDITVYQ